MDKPATAHSIRQCLALLVLVCSAVHSAAVQAEWLYRDEAIMGTRCAVELWATDRSAGEAAMEAVFADMRRIDVLMSTYKPDSEDVAGQRRGREGAGAGQRGAVQPAARRRSEYSRLSSGAFDITYASVGYLYDYRAHRAAR